MIISGWQKSKVSSPKIRNDSLYVWEGGYSISSLSLCTRTTTIFMTKMTKNGTDVGELCRQSWMVILKSAPHKANFENDIPHHRDCQWSTIGRDWNWIKRKLFLLLWSPSFLLPLSNCCNKDTVGCSVQWQCLLSKPKFNSKFLWQFLEDCKVQGVQERNCTWIPYSKSHDK